jgi:hypothetical protein
MFFPQCAQPSFTPLQNNRKDYCYVDINLYIWYSNLEDFWPTYGGPPLHSFTFLDCKSWCRAQIVTGTESCIAIRSLIVQFVDRLHHHHWNIIWWRNGCGVSVDMQETWNRRQAMLTAVSFRRYKKWRGNLVTATNNTRFKTSNPVFSAHIAFISLNNVNQVIFILGSVFVTYEINL